MEQEPGRTALVVDDDPDIRIMARRQLEDLGYATHAARDGEEALGLLLEGLHPDVVLLDLRMPRVDGLEVARELHDRGLLEEIPVIIFSAHGRAELFGELLCLGCRDWI
jgi:two-component system, response regulator, stage 0 sporulation protein F